MEEKKIPTDRLSISKFKLDSLLDITLSINANLPTEDLLSKYEYILRNNLGIGKILIFKHFGGKLIWLQIMTVFLFFSSGFCLSKFYMYNSR